MSLVIDFPYDPSTLLCGLTDEVIQSTAKIASFPSQAPAYYYSNHHIFFVNRSIDFVAPHYVLNAFMVLLCVGFLSWCLDSSHGPDIKYIPPPPSPEEKPVENISSVDPKADRRRSILKRTRSRRLTIENIARMIEIEDQKRQEVFGPTPSPLDASPAAMDMGIGGGDVGLNVWSLNQEIRLLREIDMQIEKDGLTTTTATTGNKKVEEVTQQQTEDNLPVVSTIQQQQQQQPYTMDSARKMDFKARVLLRVRVPLRWAM